jgi:hypothetical protein
VWSLKLRKEHPPIYVHRRLDWVRSWQFSKPFSEIQLIQSAGNVSNAEQGNGIRLIMRLTQVFISNQMIQPKWILEYYSSWMSVSTPETTKACRHRMHTGHQAGVSMQRNDRFKAWNLARATCGAMGFRWTKPHDYSMTGWTLRIIRKECLHILLLGFGLGSMVMNVTANESLHKVTKSYLSSST